MQPSPALRCGRMMMDGMLPVWDFSLPEFDLLQAEQAELLWKPDPDVADVVATAPGPAAVQVATPTVFRNSFGSTTAPPRDGSFQERSFAAMPQSRSNAVPGQAPVPSRQDSLLPTPSPAEDFDNSAVELHQRQRTGSLDTTERSKAVNRESQRRFRLRQKVLLSAFYKDKIA